MNLDAIKKKLDSMSKSTNNSSSGNNFPQTRKFKPSIGKQTVRVVPFKYNKDYPFTEMKFYYGIGKFKLIASPLNWEEKDPIAEFAKQLRGTNDKENWRLAKKLDPKTRIFVPVIVRGQESEGVQLWEFGKEIYEAFLQMAADEEVGDFSNIMNGRDIKLVTVGPDVTGTKYNKTTISPSMKQTQLSTDSTQVETWLEDQQNPKETYRPLPFDTIKGALQEWLSPEEENEGDITSQPAEGFSDDKVDSNYSLSTKKKETKTDKFDAMFDEESDDLPF
tara:strand:+ start:1730 stop:2560 length:831 start_codon:yes stop_codon:yes gene_type:complete